MKLLTRTSLYYMAVALVLFVAAGVVFYFLMKADIDEDFTENLLLEKEQVEQFVADSLELPIHNNVIGDKIDFEIAESEVEELLRDTLLYNHMEEEEQLYRLLVFSVEMDEQYYKVTISKALFDSADIVEASTIAFAVVAVATLALLLLLNWMLSRQLWKPFHLTLKSIAGFELVGSAELKLAQTRTTEFNQLNSEVERLAQKVRSDYRTLKEFSENASHEIQTPLAIIRSKLELLLQQNKLDEAQLKLIHEAFETCGRISRLNESLLLLAKIENRQFSEKENCDLHKLCEQKLVQLEELMALKNLRVEKTLERCSQQMNIHLIEILLTNLFANAINHNTDGGFIRVETSANEFSISNSAKDNGLNSEKIFERFAKSTSGSSGNGLGLAIVKSICDLHGFSITHQYNEGVHAFQIVMANPSTGSV